MARLHPHILPRFGLFPDKPPSTGEGRCMVAATIPKFRHCCGSNWDKTCCRCRFAWIPKGRRRRPASEAERVTLSRVRSQGFCAALAHDQTHRLLWYNDALPRASLRYVTLTLAIESRPLFLADFQQCDLTGLRCAIRPPAAKKLVCRTIARVPHQPICYKANIASRPDPRRRSTAQNFVQDP